MAARSLEAAIDVVHVENDQHRRTLYTLQRSGQFTAGVESIDPLCSVPQHKHHDTEEILFCTQGKGTVRLQDETGAHVAHAFLPGVMVLVPKGRLHSIHNDSTVEDLWLSFTLKGEQANSSFMAALA
mmetsp:Transcript_11000/g.44909  ORF Transcript_11000/g.44909 Transcript_11000/m.44909 type:complete len:127 (-) Transcript_11000:94-474(-)